MEGSRDGAMADGASRGPQSRYRPLPKLTTENSAAMPTLERFERQCGLWA
jgi:hypothetical protein